MKKILLGVAGVLGLLVVGVAGAAAMQPDSVHIERSVVVAAAPGDVFPFANDMAKWQQWNPWREYDPNQTETLSEPTVGKGAWYAWKGDQTGSGRMDLVESVAPEKVVYDLAFIEPFEAHAKVSIVAVAEGEGTKVTWGYDAEQPFASKVFAVFTDMDAMLGADFERGLGKLKPLAEAEATKRLEAEKAAAEAAAAATAAVDGAAADPAAPAAN